jgi:hypothetical protein
MSCSGKMPDHGGGSWPLRKGANLVMGHGPHMPLGIEIYKDKPIFYGVGSFSFETGHRARTHPDWIGLMLYMTTEDGGLARGVLLRPPQRAERNSAPDPLPRSNRNLTTCLTSQHASALYWKSRETKSWCGQSRSSVQGHAMRHYISASRGLYTAAIMSVTQMRTPDPITPHWGRFAW